MTRPVLSLTSERLYEGLPEFYREQDPPADWPLLRYLGLMGEVAGQLETLLNRMDYLTPGERQAATGLVPPANALVRTNVAAGRVPTVNGVPLPEATDGTLTPTAAAGNQLLLDLGTVRWLDQVTVAHHTDGRVFHGSKLEVSEDGIDWTTLFDSVGHGPNLLGDGSYEAGVVGSTSGYFGSVPELVTPGRSSGWAYGFRTTSATNPQGMIQRLPVGVAVPLGTMVRLAGWVKGPVGAKVYFDGRAARPDGTGDTESILPNGRVTVALTGAWQYVEGVEFTVTTGIGAGAGVDTHWRPSIQVRYADAWPKPAVGVDFAWDDLTITARVEYAEPAAGKVYNFPMRKVRYIRDSIAGSNIDASNYWAEISAELTATGTSELVDPAYADEAWLPWLAQLVGARLGPNTTTAERRAAIAGGVGSFLAGTRQGIAQAARTVLTGSQSVTVIDHFGGDPWALAVSTMPDETPDAALVADAVIRAGAKPAGFTVVHTFYAASWALVESNLPTWGAIEAKGTWQGVTSIT